MKRVFLAAMCLLSSMLTMAQYSGSGNGTAEDPYVIYNESQLSQVSNFLNQTDVYFKLMKDLDLSSFINENYPSEGWTPIGVSSTPFKGFFDGNNHTLSGIWINKGSIDNVGFFGYIDGATISNLTLVGSSVTGVNQVGAFVGYATGSTITGCSATFTGQLQGSSNVGGFVGQAASTTIKNGSITFADKVKGTTNVGGFVGQANSCTIQNMTVQTAIQGSSQVGGFAGKINATNISSVQVHGNVTGTGSDIAGIVGNAAGTQTIQNATHIGDVSGTATVAGIAGTVVLFSSPTFKSCFSKGKITNTGDYTGGIIAKAGALAGMTNCSHFGDIVGKQHTGGLIGALTTSNAISDNNVYISTSSSSNTKTATKAISSLTSAAPVGTAKSVNNCTAIGNITGTSYVGGLVGLDEGCFVCSDWTSGGKASISGSFTKKYSESGTKKESAYIWFNGQSRGSKSVSASSTSSNDYTPTFTPSFSPNITVNTTNFTNSYYSGIINGTDNVGGIAGNKISGKIQYCYTHASVYANNQVGGIIGNAAGTSLRKLTLESNVAINNTISATVANIGRIYGKCDANTTIGPLASATGNRALTTTKVINKGVVQEITDDLQNGNVMGPSLLKLKANYVALGWNFDNDWSILETESYPYKRYQAAPPVIESNLVSQDTIISGSSTNGGTVYLYYKDRDAVSTVCDGHAWSFATEPLQSGAAVQLYSDVDDMTPSYLVSTTVGYLGSGTEADPYRIYTADDLQGASNRGYYKIMNDIDLTVWINENSAKKGWVAIGRNSGESTYIDGDGHKITGLWINTTEDYTGLFSNFSAGVIKNLTVEVAQGKSVKGGNYTGVLIGRNANGQIINCNVKGDVSGTSIVGGVVGYSQNNTIQNVSYNGKVTSATANAKVGGLTGSSTNDQLSLLRMNATISVTNSGAYVGGLVGYTKGSTLTHTTAQANITVSGASSNVGGLVGYSESQISESYSTGSVSCTGDESYTGGLVGMAKAKISDCYSTAAVTGTLHTAGLCAYTYSELDKCYAKGSVDGVTYGAGVVSKLDGSAASISNCVAVNNTISLTAQSAWGCRVIGGFCNGASEPGTTNFALDAMQVSLNGVPQTKTDDNIEGIAKSASELMSASFYSNLGWEMGPVWSIEAGEAYPFLLWEVDVTLVTQLSLNPTVLSIAQGKSDTLDVTVLPLHATNKNVTWTTSNPNIVTVTDGIVNAVGIGSATITVTTTDGSDISATCAVTVVANKDEAIANLQDLINQALDLYNNSVEGQNIGEYQSGARAELYAVITAVSATVSDVMTDAQISAGMTQLTDAIVTFQGKQITTGGDTDITQFRNVVYFDEFECRAGNPVTLHLQMRNQDPVIGFNFKLYLPDGISVSTSVDEFDDVVIEAGLSGNRTSASRHTFETALNQEGVLTVLCYSTKTYTFTGNDGEVAYIKLNVDEDMEAGEYPLIIREEAISLSGSTPQISYIKSSIIVSRYQLGDANGDTYINVGDITAVASYILDNTPDNFVPQAADANEDGSINVGDITTIATMILNDGHTPSTRFAMASKEEMPQAQFALDVDQLSENNMIVHVGSVNSENAYSAFQFDLQLPSDVLLSDVEIQNRCSHLTYDMVLLDNNIVRILAYSLNDARVFSTSGDIVTIMINGMSNEEFTLTNGIFANAHETIYASDVTASYTSPQDLENVTESKNVEIYDILGRKLNRLGKGIQIVGNQVVLIP